MSMKWRHWSILIVLVLLNYIIFSAALTKLAEQRRPGPRPTRTLQPTFEAIDPTPLAWKVLPTSTPQPTRTPFTPMPTETLSATAQITATVAVTVTPAGQPVVPSASPSATATATTQASPTNTPAPPSATPLAEPVIHVVKRGETLSGIALVYGVTVRAIADANGLPNPNHIITGQRLTIPSPGTMPPTAVATPRPLATNTPKPVATKAPAAKPTPKPPMATPTQASAGFQFTAEVIWDPLVAPNCSGPAIGKQSVVKNADGSPINGARIEVDCYGNVWKSHPSGNPGEYEAGHYDFVFGQSTPQDWICTARIFDVDGQAVASSEVVSIHFDTNDCKPHGAGHQVAIVNWTKHW
jgi:LysM repeat protein